MTIEQIRVGLDNFSYIIYCTETRKAAIVDPSLDASKQIDFIFKNNLELIFLIITHHHGDHSREAKSVKKQFPHIKMIMSKEDGKRIRGIDIFISDNEEIILGKINLKFLLTPGHTPGGICIIVDNKAILTGDTLFIGDCGRTDLPGGNLGIMFDTLQNKIMNLADNLIVYPGHDYGDKPFDTLGSQKKTNKTLLAKTIEDFSRI